MKLDLRTPTIVLFLSRDDVDGVQCHRHRRISFVSSFPLSRAQVIATHNGRHHNHCHYRWRHTVNVECDNVDDVVVTVVIVNMIAKKRRQEKRKRWKKRPWIINLSALSATQSRFRVMGLHVVIICCVRQQIRTEFTELSVASCTYSSHLRMKETEIVVSAHRQTHTHTHEWLAHFEILFTLCIICVL